ncbi:MAG: DUF4145 domain-containing protein [Ruminococcus sp.]|nr:DUF4145 domain-containing protein [Ruminococcus sp.]
MENKESLYDRLGAVDILLENSFSTPAAVLMRTVIEHMVNVMIIDCGLWQTAMKGKNYSTPNLSHSIDLLREKKFMNKVFNDNIGMIIQTIKNFGNSASHNSFISMSEAQGCRHFLSGLADSFAEYYPDEIYIRDFPAAMIDVTGRFKDKTITIKSVRNNRFLTVHNDGDSAGNVYFTVKEADAWEKLLVRVSDDGHTGFKGINGKWLSVNNVGNTETVFSNAPELSSWEFFKIFKSGDKYRILSLKNNKYLSLHIDDKNKINRLNANASDTSKNSSAFLIDIVD